MKYLRKYMFHVQNSVFEGELTPAMFQQVKYDLEQMISSDESVMFYYSHENKKLKRDVIGKKKDLNIII